jgi:hypothetical protein
MREPVMYLATAPWYFLPNTQLQLTIVFTSLSRWRSTKCQQSMFTTFDRSCNISIWMQFRWTVKARIYRFTKHFVSCFTNLTRTDGHFVDIFMTYKCIPVVMNRVDSRYKCVKQEMYLILEIYIQITNKPHELYVSWRDHFELPIDTTIKKNRRTFPWWL